MFQAIELFRSELLRMMVTCAHGRDLERAYTVRAFREALSETTRDERIAGLRRFVVTPFTNTGIVILGMNESRASWFEIVGAYGCTVMSWETSPSAGHYGDADAGDFGVDIVAVPESDRRVYWIDRTGRGRQEIDG